MSQSASDAGYASADAESASSRVFAIPELLAQILIHFGRQAVTNHVLQCTYVRRDAYVARPATQLFVLQRVNAAFRYTLNETKELREHMLLRPYVEFRSESNVVCPRPSGSVESDAIYWLLTKLDVGVCVSRIEENEISVFLVTYVAYPEHFSDKQKTIFDDDVFGSVNSSWRKIVMGASQERKALKVDFMVTSPCKIWHLKKTFDKDGTTLGMVYDWLRQGRDDSSKEHEEDEKKRKEQEEDRRIERAIITQLVAAEKEAYRRECAFREKQAKEKASHAEKDATKSM